METGKKSRAVKIILIILLCIALLVAVFGGTMLYFSKSSNPFSHKTISIDSDSKEDSVIDYYALAVNNSKSTENFSLKVTTSFEINNFECSQSFIQKMFETMMSSDMAQFDDIVLNYTFSNGICNEDNSITPLSIIQPSDRLIENVNYDSITATLVANFDDYTYVSFTVGPEKEDFGYFMELMTKAQSDTEPDFSVLENIDVAPNHSQFTDFASIFESMMPAMEMNESEYQSSERAEYENQFMGDSTAFFNSITAEYKEMLVSSAVNEDNLLNSLTITTPISFEANMNMFNKDMDILYEIILTQTFEFSY